MKKAFVTLIVLLCLFCLTLLVEQNRNSKMAVSGNYRKNMELLARVINGESRGEPYEGQVAVGAVILNRVRDPKFPNTIAGVIYEPGEFASVSSGEINDLIHSEDMALKAAQDALNGWDPTNGAVYYFNFDTEADKRIESKQLVKKIGKYKFYK